MSSSSSSTPMVRMHRVNPRSAAHGHRVGGARGGRVRGARVAGVGEGGGRAAGVDVPLWGAATTGVGVSGRDRRRATSDRCLRSTGQVARHDLRAARWAATSPRHDGGHQSGQGLTATLPSKARSVPPTASSAAGEGSIGRVDAHAGDHLPLVLHHL